jgi:hypothetical protein
MSLLRFKVFQPIFFKTVTLFSIWVSAFLYAGSAYSADVTLAWDGVSQSGVSVTGYRVYYRTDSSTGLTKGCEVANTSCTVFDLADGETYHFVATAYNSYGESEPSDPVSYTVPDVLQTFTITASAGGNGSILPVGTVSVTEGQSKTFTISPKSGFHIDGVLVDGVFKGTTSTYTFQNLSASHTIYATFASNPVPSHTIAASTTSHGNINPQGNVTVNEGNNQNFSITPDTGYHIADVRVDGHSVGARANFEFPNVTEGHTISASFAANMFTITAAAGSNGSITPGTVSIAQGSGKTFTIAANSGYEIADVIVDDKSKGAVTSYTFNNIAANHTIAASFAAVPASVPSDEGSSDSTTATNPSGSSDLPPPTGVTTENNDGILSPAITPAQEFVNQAPNQPGLLYPVDGAQDVSLTPLIEIAGFTDPDADDDHGATRWQIAADESFEQLILDVMIDRSRTNNYLVSFLVPDGALCSEQLYYWRASVKDARDGDHKWSNWSEPFKFTTAAKVQADVNGNGVADDEEPPYSDLDNDGLNDNDQPFMRVYKSRIDQSLIGINAVEGVSRINCFTSIDPESIPDEPRPKLKYGLMVFNVALNQIGGTAKFELYLPEEPQSWAKWFKYDPINGWYEFPVDSDGDKYYIEITDGGFGDADGVVNGIIVDPIGLADMSNEVESVDALDAVDSGDSESTMDRMKNACFIQVALDRPAEEATDAGARQIAAFRFIYCGFMALVLAVAVIQVMGGRRGHRTHSSPRSTSRSRSA